MDNLAERDAEDGARDREHKLYSGFSLAALPGTEEAQERVADARTVHLAEDREAAEDAMTDAGRVIGWDRTQSREGEGDGAESAEDGTHE